MKVKLDENLVTRGVSIFATHGHDVKTVVEQDMQSYSDHDLISKCKDEKRCREYLPE